MADAYAWIMRIAVIGSGISGLASAWMLSQDHEVTLYEAGDYLGGHTHTHDVQQDGLSYAVDSGFIVFNRQHYPLLAQLFADLGVASQPTEMSFSVQHAGTGLEYNAGTLNGLFCQRRNLLSPRFLGMVRDLVRFYREAPALLHQTDDHRTLGDYLAEHGYGAAFREITWCRWHLRCGPPLPRRSCASRRAIWCSSWPITRCCRPVRARNGKWCAVARSPMCARCARAGG